MTNHYIPTIDELYCGFECKIHVGNNQFDNYTVSPYTDFTIPISEYRVKCLDKDDIVELGFNIKKEFEGVTFFYINVPHSEPLYYNLELNDMGSAKYVSILDTYKNVVIDRMHIRNKNELKWILNRYGILTK